MLTTITYNIYPTFSMYDKLIIVEQLGEYESLHENKPHTALEFYLWRETKIVYLS